MGKVGKARTRSRKDFSDICVAAGTVVLLSVITMVWLHTTHLADHSANLSAHAIVKGQQRRDSTNAAAVSVPLHTVVVATNGDKAALKSSARWLGQWVDVYQDPPLDTWAIARVIKFDALTGMAELYYPMTDEVEDLEIDKAKVRTRHAPEGFSKMIGFSELEDVDTWNPSHSPPPPPPPRETPPTLRATQATAIPVVTVTALAPATQESAARPVASGVLEVPEYGDHDSISRLVNQTPTERPYVPRTPTPAIGERTVNGVGGGENEKHPDAAENSHVPDDIEQNKVNEQAMLRLSALLGIKEKVETDALTPKPIETTEPTTVQTKPKSKPKTKPKSKPKPKPKKRKSTSTSKSPKPLTEERNAQWEDAQKVMGKLLETDTHLNLVANKNEVYAAALAVMESLHKYDSKNRAYIRVKSQEELDLEAATIAAMIKGAVAHMKSNPPAPPLHTDMHAVDKMVASASDAYADQAAHDANVGYVHPLVKKAVEIKGRVTAEADLAKITEDDAKELLAMLTKQFRMTPK